MLDTRHAFFLSAFTRVFHLLKALEVEKKKRVMRLETSQFLQFLNVANRTSERPHITHIQTAVIVTVVLARATTGV